MISERATRQDHLARYVAGKKVKVMVAMSGHKFYQNHGRVNIFYVDGVVIGHANEDEDDYPSEGLMATVALAVNATVGAEGIPSGQTISPEERARRDKYRENLGQWREHFDVQK